MASWRAEGPALTLLRDGGLLYHRSWESPEVDDDGGPFLFELPVVLADDVRLVDIYLMMSRSLDRWRAVLGDDVVAAVSEVFSIEGRLPESAGVNASSPRVELFWPTLDLSAHGVPAAMDLRFVDAPENRDAATHLAQLEPQDYIDLPLIVDSRFFVQLNDEGDARPLGRSSPTLFQLTYRVMPRLAESWSARTAAAEPVAEPGDCVQPAGRWLDTDNCQHVVTPLLDMSVPLSGE